MSDTIKGIVKKIIFQSEDNGFTILQIEQEDKKKPIVAKGNILGIREKDGVSLHGNWVKDKKYGLQFNIEDYEIEEPSTKDGIIAYLSSGLFKGIGESIAKSIVNKFGEHTLEMMDSNIDKLIEIKGISNKKLEDIKESWNFHKGSREIMPFLKTHGISTGYAIKIYRQYGNQAKEILSKNPYRIAVDIDGIGFKIADMIAFKFGFSKLDERRLDAGILYTLNDLSTNGHVCYPYEGLKEKASEIMEVDESFLDKSIEKLKNTNDVVIVNGYVFSRSNFEYEYNLATNLNQLNNHRDFLSIENKKIDDIVLNEDITLSEGQKQAIMACLENKITVITGQPGVGKTMVIKSITDTFKKHGYTVDICAPTGRASKRVSELTGHYSQTIHRLLEYRRDRESGRWVFTRNSDNKLNSNVIIIDESSMIDIKLAYYLTNAIPLSSKIIIVGDNDQLPSVGCGNFLSDILHSNKIKSVKLDKIFRQDKDSGILINANLINKGNQPLLNEYEDFKFIERDEQEDVFKVIVKLVHDFIPKKLDLDPISDIQVLSPMNKGYLGTVNFNKYLQPKLNPDNYGTSRFIKRGDKTYYIGDKVMQIKNNYDKDVFNGDIGIIRDIRDNELHIDFYGNMVEYDKTELGELNLAYSISIHKFQGSECPCVVMPIHTSHYIMLKRNLIYTGITRAKQYVFLVGTKRAMMIAVKKDDVVKRYSYLTEFLDGTLEKREVLT